MFHFSLFLLDFFDPRLPFVHFVFIIRLARSDTVSANLNEKSQFGCGEEEIGTRQDLAANSSLGEVGVGDTHGYSAIKS